MSLSARPRYCDMYPASRLCQSDMFLPEDRLLRHVPGQPAPPERHVPLGGPTTATGGSPAEARGVNRVTTCAARSAARAGWSRRSKPAR